MAFQLPHAIYIIFLFALGACVGSFLNVVVWRLPRVELPERGGVIRDFLTCFRALSDPPSHCPQCDQRLKWYDNIPIFGWIKLLGRCRFCKQPFSIRYPIVETVTALLFVGYYIAYFMLQWRACCPQPQIALTWHDEFGIAHDVIRPVVWIFTQSWPIYLLYMMLISSLLAASLIDAELYIIPIQIPWVVAVIGLVVHSIVDHPTLPGSLNLVGVYSHITMALSAGSALGLIVSMTLWARGIIPTSFPQGEPMLEVERDEIQDEMDRAKRAGDTTEFEPLPPRFTPGQIRREIAKEMLFLLPPLILGGAFVAASVYLPVVGKILDQLKDVDWLTGLLGSLLGAMAGAFTVWIVRILGTIAFRKVAMGLGDVHLMFGVGAVIGAEGAVVAFFLAPFFGILVAVYTLITRKSREIPLGPYLSLATAIVMLFYCWIAAHVDPGLQGIMYLLSGR